MDITSKLQCELVVITPVVNQIIVITDNITHFGVFMLQTGGKPRTQYALIHDFVHMLCRSTGAIEVNLLWCVLWADAQTFAGIVKVVS